MSLLKTLFLFFTAFFLLAACGVKGPPLPPEHYKAEDENAIYVAPKTIPMEEALKVADDGTSMEYVEASNDSSQTNQKKKKRRHH